MTRRLSILLAAIGISATPFAVAQAPSLTTPKTVDAGSAFSIQTSGSGKAELFILGPGQALKREVQLGEPASFPAGSLLNAGRYSVMLKSDSNAASETLDVAPAARPADLTFLAKPSRLPVGMHDGITGAVYVFDAYHNLITTPMPVSFQLSTPAGASQSRVLNTRDGAAWIAMDSTGRQGADKFIASIGDVSVTRVVAQVPGDPCTLKMSASPAGQQIQLITQPVVDCNGNAVPDGTIVTFTENYKGGQSAVDVPLKRGIAEVQMPTHSGATLSVASGVVMGNQIGWSK